MRKFSNAEYCEKYEPLETMAIGFVGPSGSGKSHRATWVSGERGINFILDDGILINGTTIIAGVSAKKERTKIGSIKRALLTDDTHAKDIRAALDKYKVSKLLILGTSIKMVRTIAKRLGIHEISEVIYINEVASEFEIKKATDTRKMEGKHVIPVPTFEIKKHFSGYLLDPLQIFRKKDKDEYQFIGEKSVVRPTFSYLGSYIISDYTIHQICEYAVANIKGIDKIYRLKVESGSEGIRIDMEIVAVYGYTIKELAHEAQKRVKEEIEKLTSLNIMSLNVLVKSLVLS